jgi:prepilin-type N-terminal cleavage/methylation domain-containing protein
MNMILKKRLANRGVARSGGVVSRRRKGFTLVEVIVVLVILAILAAIAIPALTGYIDKAKWTEFKKSMHTQLTAIQVIITDLATEGGGIKTYVDTNIPEGADFFKVTLYTDAKSYVLERLTSEGKAKYTELTGDTWSFGSGQILYAQTNISGAIKAYEYWDGSYFDSASTWLAVFYIENIDSTDSATTKFKSTHSQYPNLTSGFNFYQVVTSPYSFKKLD